MTDNTTNSNPASVGTWAGSGHHVPVPDTSMLPGTEQAPSPAAALLKRAVQGAHDTIDRLADSAVPTVRQMGDGVSGAEDALHAKLNQLRATRDEWAESTRIAVRGNPLVAVAAALALGVLIARIIR